MNLIKTSQLSIVEFLKYVSDGQEHLSEIIARKKSNCQRRTHWVSKTTKRDTSLPWHRDPLKDGGFLPPSSRRDRSDQPNKRRVTLLNANLNKGSPRHSLRGSIEKGEASTDLMKI